MTNATVTPAPTLTLLRGDRHTRPARNLDVSTTLRHSLEEHFALSAVPALVIRASSLRARSYGPDSSSFAHLRGLLVGYVVRLLASGVHVDDAFSDAVAAWGPDAQRSTAAQDFASLDNDQRARLEADVRSHASVVRAHLSGLPSSWRPRTAVRTSIVLGNGAFELRDEIDLTLGTVASDVANVVVLDVMSGPLGLYAERVLRYHALTHTLRTGVMPLRSAVLSSATGELWSRVVDASLLDDAVRDLVTLLQFPEAA
jgi:hypothetical protein